MKNTKILAEINIGETFEVAGIEFIKFKDKNGITTAVSRNCLFNSEFGKNNNFSTSFVKEKLEEDILSKIENTVGAENVVEHEVDLLSLDGSDKWGMDKCRISVPTFDFYRENVKIFDKYKIDEWWWLATPDSTSDHWNDNWIVCVSPSGFIYYYDCSHRDGVRPILRFVSSIFVSHNDE